MFNYKFVLLFLLITFSNCLGKKEISTHQTRPGTIILKSIQALNLSEDMSQLSTQEDEIILKLDYSKKKDAIHWSREEVLFKEFVFDENDRTHILNYQLNLKNTDADYLIFSLVELDEENSREKIRSVLNTIIEKGDFLQPINFTKIDTSLSDDDFLGMKYISLKQSLAPKSTTILISGRQLFDKYEYQINYELE